MDVAASIIVDLCDCDASIVHVVHPSPITWSAIFSSFSAQLKLPIIPYSTWLQKLEKSAGASLEAPDNVPSNPALRLIEWFRSIRVRMETMHPDAEALGLPTLAMENALAQSATLRSEDLHQLDDVSVGKWIGYWREVGHLPL